MFPRSEIVEKLKKVNRGDLLILEWHDACAFSRAIEIGPQVYVTKKKTVGYFYGLFDAPDHTMSYVVLVSEETDGTPSDGSSIPLGCIEEVHIRHGKTAKDALKARKESEIPIKTVSLTEKIFMGRSSHLD